MGAWMLDWPGAFTWGTTREGVLARATSAVHRFVEWLERHGDTESPPIPLVAEVVEEEPTVRLDDGYQQMATFSADDRPVDMTELDRHLARLRHARQDLLQVVEELRVLEREGAAVAGEPRDDAGVASGALAARQLGQVYAHIGQTDAWFVSRLDPGARYEGPREEDVDSFLEQSFGFLLERLRHIQQAHPSAKRVDGRGETWTLAKLMRRTLYHALDHLEELSRGLDQATGAVDRFEIRKQATIEPAELRRLFRRAGIGRRARDSDARTAQLLAGSTETVSAWDGDELVGFGRIVSDEVTNGYISSVAVAPRWQDRGLGTRLMRALMDGREHLKLTLDVREGAEPFYERLGFARARTVFVRPRAEVAE